MARKQAVIIGGGIGGLAVALALKQHGVAVTVYEQADQPRESGAGIWLWANALHALAALGLFEQVRAIGVPGTESQVRTWRGKPLISLVAPQSAWAFGIEHIAVHRAEFQALLLRALGLEHVRFNACCTAVEQDGLGVTARFAHGETARGDLLIGADGIHSVIRQQLWGAAQPRYGGYLAWRAVIPFDHRRFVPGTAWASSARFGFMPLSGGRVNWFAGRLLPRDTAEPAAGRKAEVLEYFRDWHPPIAEVIAATPEAAILRHPVYDYAPLKRWSRGRITLLGDAAHAMLPSLGQGACQALEDAVVLAQCIGTQPNVSAALQIYDQRRVRRTAAIVRQSRRMDRLMLCRSPFVAWCRNLIVAHLPAVLRARQIRWILEHRPI